MLPAAAGFYFPWEISCDLVKDGASLRTCGRYIIYCISLSNNRLIKGGRQHVVLEKV